MSQKTTLDILQSPNLLVMRIKQPVMVLCGAATLLLASCATKSTEPQALDMDKIKPEIQAMEDAYSAGEKAKDADKVVAYYSDDAISYSRNQPPTVGKAAIRDSIAARLARDTSGTTYVYKVVDLFGEGNTLVEIGSWSNMSPEGTETDKGHYLSVFRKKDGKYECIRDMNVTSSPAK